MRIRLSNQFGRQPVTFRDIYIGKVEEGAALLPRTNTRVTFGGKETVTIEPGMTAHSDPLRFKVEAGRIWRSACMCPGRAGLSAGIGSPNSAPIFPGRATMRRRRSPALSPNRSSPVLADRCRCDPPSPDHRGIVTPGIPSPTEQAPLTAPTIAIPMFCRFAFARRDPYVCDERRHLGKQNLAG